jgi:hypothetical protein
MTPTWGVARAHLGLRAHEIIALHSKTALAAVSIAVLARVGLVRWIGERLAFW